MRLDRRYLIWALCYAVAGMGLGIFMAASHNHVQHVTHAHILLVGFVVSFLYGAIHKLWLDGLPSRLAQVQFYVHQAGALILFTGLLLFYGNFVRMETIDPILGLASITVLVGAVLMLVLVLKSRSKAEL